jgi:hypothetical protein
VHAGTASDASPSAKRWERHQQTEQCSFQGGACETSSAGGPTITGFAQRTALSTLMQEGAKGSELRRFAGRRQTSRCEALRTDPRVCGKRDRVRTQNGRRAAYAAPVEGAPQPLVAVKAGLGRSFSSARRSWSRVTGGVGRVAGTVTIR